MDEGSTGFCGSTEQGHPTQAWGSGQGNKMGQVGEEEGREAPKCKGV